MTLSSWSFSPIFLQVTVLRDTLPSSSSSSWSFGLVREMCKWIGGLLAGPCVGVRPCGLLAEKSPEGFEVVVVSRRRTEEEAMGEVKAFTRDSCECSGVP